MSVPVTPGELGYEPGSPAFIADPYPVFARLRADHPVIHDPTTDQWLVSRFADVGALLRDRRLGRSYVHVATHEDFGVDPARYRKLTDTLGADGPFTIFAAMDGQYAKVYGDDPAAMAAMKPAALITAQDFERASVDVRLAA